MKKVLVTGGAGYIGSHACRELALNGYIPVVYDDLSRGHGEFVNWGPLVKGRLQETEKLTRALIEHKISAVMHFAAFAYVGESVTHPQMYYENNFGGSLSLLQAMDKAKVPYLVFSSTCATYGDVAEVPILESHPQKPINPYGMSKWMVEKMINDLQKTGKIKAVCLRYFNAAGASPDGKIGEKHNPETHLIPLILQVAKGLRNHIQIFGSDYPTADGTCIRDYIHVCDLARAHVLSLEKLFQESPLQFAYNLGTGKGFSVKEIIQTCEKITGRKIKTEVTSRRAGDPPELVAKVDLAKIDLGFNCIYSDIENILSTAWSWENK